MYTLLVVLATTEGGDAAQRGGGSALTSLLPFLILGLVFYFLIIRPQRNRQKAQQQVLRSVGVGDEVVTIGGFHGTVVAVSDDTLELELAPGTVVTLSRQAVGKVLTENPTSEVDDEDLMDDEDLLDDEDVLDEQFEEQFAEDDVVADDDDEAEDRDRRDGGR